MPNKPIRPLYAGHVATAELRKRLDRLIAEVPAMFAKVENVRVTGLANDILGQLEDHAIALDGLIRQEYGVTAAGRQAKSCGANKDGGGGFQPGNSCGKDGGGGGGSAAGKLVKQDSGLLDKNAKELKAVAEKEGVAVAELQSAVKEARWEKQMGAKSPSDRKAFEAARKDGIVIPPAWTEVEYFGKDEDKRARGRDAAGRWQTSENPEYRQRVSDENNARIAKELTPRMGEVRDALRSEVMGGSEEAKVLYLITETGFRIGGAGDGKSKAEAIGASTLRGEHVQVAGDSVTFDFPGKKGVRQLHTVNDPVIASMVRDAEPGRNVFNTADSKVRDYWKSNHGGKKVHDIRHAVATETAVSEMNRLVPPHPKTDRDRKAVVKQVLAVASGRLGNNPKQALDTYIDPSIWGQLK